MAARSQRRSGPNTSLKLAAPPPDAHAQATKRFLSRISKYAGVALQDEAFTHGIFNYMVVPGRAWSTAELAAAAPVQLKTL